MKSLISSKKKKSLKMIKYMYWQRNDGFTFWPEVKITCLIDMLNGVFLNQFFSLKVDTVKS